MCHTEQFSPCTLKSYKNIYVIMAWKTRETQNFFLSDLSFLNLQEIMKMREKRKKRSHCQKWMIRTGKIWRGSLKGKRTMWPHSWCQVKHTLLISVSFIHSANHVYCPSDTCRVVWISVRWFPVLLCMVIRQSEIHAWFLILHLGHWQAVHIHSKEWN
jgi:hypothetical protein